MTSKSVDDESVKHVSVPLPKPKKCQNAPALKHAWASPETSQAFGQSLADNIPRCFIWLWLLRLSSMTPVTTARKLNATTYHQSHSWNACVKLATCCTMRASPDIGSVAPGGAKDRTIYMEFPQKQ